MTLARLTPLAFALLAACAAEPPGEQATPIRLDASQEAMVQEGVRGALKDPESARFGPMAASRVPPGTRGGVFSVPPEGGVAVCGYVNARNSFGGYNGQTPFMGMLKPDGFDLDRIASDDAASWYPTMCEYYLGVRI